MAGLADARLNGRFARHHDLEQVLGLGADEVPLSGRMESVTREDGSVWFLVGGPCYREIRYNTPSTPSYAMEAMSERREITHYAGYAAGGGALAFTWLEKDPYLLNEVGFDEFHSAGVQDRTLNAAVCNTARLRDPDPAGPLFADIVRSEIGQAPHTNTTWGIVVLHEQASARVYSVSAEGAGQLAAADELDQALGAYYGAGRYPEEPNATGGPFPGSWVRRTPYAVFGGGDAAALTVYVMATYFDQSAGCAAVRTDVFSWDPAAGAVTFQEQKVNAGMAPAGDAAQWWTSGGVEEADLYSSPVTLHTRREVEVSGYAGLGNAGGRRTVTETIRLACGAVQKTESGSVTGPNDYAEVTYGCAHLWPRYMPAVLAPLGWWSDGAGPDAVIYAAGGVTRNEYRTEPWPLELEYDRHVGFFINIGGVEQTLTDLSGQGIGYTWTQRSARGEDPSSMRETFQAHGRAVRDVSMARAGDALFVSYLVVGMDCDANEAYSETPAERVFAAYSMEAGRFGLPLWKGAIPPLGAQRGVLAAFAAA